MPCGAKVNDNRWSEPKHTDAERVCEVCDVLGGNNLSLSLQIPNTFSPPEPPQQVALIIYCYRTPADFRRLTFSKSQLGFRYDVNPPPAPGQQQGAYRAGEGPCDAALRCVKHWSTLQEAYNHKLQPPSPPTSSELSFC